MTFKVVITGASGVLGSAIRNAFKGQAQVLALSFTRSGNGLTQLDLLDQNKLESTLRDFKSDWVIHCAAERRPDVAEKDPDGTQKLNADVPLHLAQLAKSLDFTLIYISTDYVFDGTSPPYAPDASPNPLQLYGRTKRDGELSILSVQGAAAAILRVPVLYGPAPNNSDSAVNILVDVVKDQSGKTYKMDHYATRYPTNVVDIANFLVRLSASKTPIPTILHYSGDEPFTKYEMCLIFAKILSLPHEHIIPDAAPPTGAGATTRPRDCRLGTKETDDLALDGGLGLGLFEEWWTGYLQKQ
ncbi:RmlD-sub-bind domain-containing protein [Mycena indigotica]|uniref:RmlD-sub-bind domain-containing protein n=1 Tax=Mycena indigotica TaxID=2126181 RepID=A0A8H6TFA9_9AGAR|nr:RmlD-sub-bind domain-containing protein [Mycena indigotica]KAF7316204.1 RmlD-sub-bind domain-containing protein [Mycena indigotica]